jgi:hypothetical protein
MGGDIRGHWTNARPPAEGRRCPSPRRPGEHCGAASPNSCSSCMGVGGTGKALITGYPMVEAAIIPQRSRVTDGSFSEYIRGRRSRGGWRDPLGCIFIETESEDLGPVAAGAVRGDVFAKGLARLADLDVTGWAGERGCREVGSHRIATEHGLNARIGVVEVGGDMFDAHPVGCLAPFAALLEWHQACIRDTVLRDYNFLTGGGSVHKRGKAGFRIIKVNKLSHECYLTNLTT